MKTGILTGCTTSGKTKLALTLAEQSGAKIEIINADSLLVFREFNIGTAKPGAAEQAHIRHHLIDIKSPDESFTAGDFVREVNTTIENIESRGKRALIVGGTGFYLKALLYGLWEAPKSEPKLRQKLELSSNSELYSRLFEKDELAALKIGNNDRYRLLRAVEIFELSGKTPTELEAQSSKEADQRFELWIVDRDNDELFIRIRQRTEEMIALGLVEETLNLRKRYPSARPLGSVGYLQVCNYLDQILPQGRKLAPGTEGLITEIELATRQLVKRQRTFFRGQTEGKWFTLEADCEGLKDRFEAVYET